MCLAGGGDSGRVYGHFHLSGPLMSTKKPSSSAVERKITLTLPTSGFRKIMPFNAYHVEKAGHGRVLHFAYLKADEIRYDMFSCFISDSDLQQNAERIGQYLVKLPEVEAPPQQWRPASQDVTGVVTTRFIQLSRAANDAEILLAFFPIHAVISRNVADGASVSVDIIAALTSDLATHRSFLLTLCSEGVG